MNLAGTHLFQASPSQIWDILMDEGKLAAITPGVSKLERTEGDHFKAISEVKIGPVKGSFSGGLSLEDKVEGESFVLKIKQKSKIGNADASVNIRLSPNGEGQTALSFDGKAKLSGLLARTGQRLLSGVANSLTKQFFEGLEKALEGGGQDMG